jgi:hypothetical protein
MWLILLSVLVHKGLPNIVEIHGDIHNIYELPAFVLQ